MSIVGRYMVTSQATPSGAISGSNASGLVFVAIFVAIVLVVFWRVVLRVALIAVVAIFVIALLFLGGELSRLGAVPSPAAQTVAQAGSPRIDLSSSNDTMTLNRRKYE